MADENIPVLDNEVTPEQSTPVSDDTVSLSAEAVAMPPMPVEEQPLEETGVSFFPHPLLIQRLDLVKYLVQCRDILLLMVGELGSGKSTFVHEFINHAQDTWQVLHFVASAELQPDHLQNELFQRLGLGEAFDAQAFASHLGELAQGNSLVLVIIDDAHVLPNETLVVLKKLAGEAQAEQQALRIILFGEPACSAALTLVPGGDHEVQVLQLDMPRYSVEETAAYIAYRFPARLAAFGADPTKVIHEIAASAAGNPARIDQAVEQWANSTLEVETVQTSSAEPVPVQVEDTEPAPLHGATAPHVHADQPMSQAQQIWLALRYRYQSFAAKKNAWVYAAGSVFVLLLVLTLLFQSAINNWFAEPVVEQEVVLDLPAPATPQPIIFPDEPTLPTQSETLVEDGRTERFTQQRTLPTRPVGAPTEIKQALPPALEEDLDNAEIMVQRDAITPPAIPDATVTITPLEAQLQPPAASLGTIVPPATAMNEVIASDPDPLTAQAEPTIEPPAQRVAATAPLVAPPPAEQAGIHREAWLVAQDSQAFTIQLLGTRKEASIEPFIKQHKLEGNVAYARTLYKDKDWYIVLYGLYENRAQAALGIKSLPEPIRSKPVWVRSLKSVQQDLQKSDPGNP